MKKPKKERARETERERDSKVRQIDTLVGACRSAANNMGGCTEKEQKV